ncbi:uncharacterized protein OCT59_027462 [Rhizophagus irregularis]|uniref:Uncharacterized protein n=1 Tax=Rhizophagus irregularis TaxID=588596 RepID=A0A915Z580_9GLOM|nr:hypothetical protein OCT59_027462 [Rhizophagus irregularis]CAB4479072.1 unnamed protein product [Rhizophagus irregularis]CAB5363169.1 unnamed protein product [Rhizophagus irregularis]
MITWNDNDGAIFCKYKRKSKSKTFNSIGFYYKMEGSMVGNDNGAPLLKKCSECNKEMNELKRMGMEELEEVNFLIWLDYICTNKENFIWRNLNILIGNWKDIKKITITAASMVKYNNDKVKKNKR